MHAEVGSWQQQLLKTLAGHAVWLCSFSAQLSPATAPFQAPTAPWSVLLPLVRWQEERDAAKQKAEADAEKKRRKAAGIKTKGGSKRKASVTAAAAPGQTRMEQFSRPAKQARVQQGSVGQQPQQQGDEQQQQQQSGGQQQGTAGDMPPPAPVNLQLQQQTQQAPGGDSSKGQQQGSQQQHGEQQQQQGADGQQAAGEVGLAA